VSWNDAVAFCEWLGKKEGKNYRLPTEAEWEYACRAGTTTRYFCGDDAEALPEVGNVMDATAREKYPDWKSTISGFDGFVSTAPVGKFRANAFGLYDMHGNVCEWCADWEANNYYRGVAGGRSAWSLRGRDPGVARRELVCLRPLGPVGVPRREDAGRPVL
jgi:formylglycine-generating enzyme